ncbi:MFS transporter (plasmid) [Rhizobium sp. NIBRBAC000502774]|nr:MFS transporter [Rhizobium sp. NIBRBAC000502774]
MRTSNDEISACPTSIIDQPKKVSTLREIVAASLGNAFEWFDFIIYGYFATILAKLFYPPGDDFTALLLVMSTFALGFIVRPLGSVIFGLYSDRYGRKKALLLTIWLMVAGTAGIGLAPTYELAGWTGAIVIVIARLLQGFASSGEYGSAVAFLVEKAPPERRNLYASFQMTSTMLAIVMAGVTGTLMVQFLDQQALESWGWRVPFLFGLLIGPVGYYIRKSVDETTEFKSAASLSGKLVLQKIFGEHLRSTMAALMITVAGTVSFYLLLVYMPTFARRELELGGITPFLSSTLAGIVLIIICPLTGFLADKISPKALLGGGLVMMAAAAYPFFAWLISAPSPARLMTTMALVSIPLAIISALTPAVVSNLYPAEVRSTGLSITYNIPPTLFGGLSPLVVSYLIATTGDKAAPAYYIVLVATVGLAGVLTLGLKQKNR